MSVSSYISHPELRSRGFTLIELSMVLVIIGLLVGGVLLGKDLIRAAETRGTISQITKFATGANGFRLKYGFLPGDIPPAKAAEFGLFQITGACASSWCKIDDGIVNDVYIFPFTTFFESVVFWRHLSETKLIEGSYGPTQAENPSRYIDATTGYVNSTSSGYLSFFYPEAKRKAYFFTVAHGSRVNNGTGAVETRPWTDLRLQRGASIPTDTGFYYAIDSKMDDGKPTTGNVIEVHGWFNDLWNVAPTDGNCTFGGSVDYGADVQYNASYNGSWMCQILIKGGF